MTSFLVERASIRLTQMAANVSENYAMISDLLFSDSCVALKFSDCRKPFSLEFYSNDSKPRGMIQTIYPSIQHINLKDRMIIQDVIPGTRIEPILGISYEALTDGVLMDVVEFLVEKPAAFNCFGVRTALPNLRLVPLFVKSRGSHKI